ncbi:MAG: hypothetical protein WC341_07760 [Bacteroidales bacterium]|jgi:hypothetical protein
MSTAIECLQSIIGISNVECQCLSPKPDNCGDSDSGLFLDSLFDINLFTALANCSETFWEALERARQTAIQDFYRDLFIRIEKDHIIKRQPYRGSIGGVNSKSKLISTQGTATGVRLYCADVVGGKIVIPTIATYFEGTGTVDLYVVDMWGNPLFAYTLNTLTGKLCENILSAPIELDLHNESVPNMEYFFYYVYDVANRPYMNDIDCRCGSFKPYYDTRRPYFNTQTGRGRGFSHWVMPGSFSGDITALDCLSPISSTIMNGLIFRDVTIKCEPSQLLCMHEWDFNHPYDVGVAFALLHKTAMFAIDYFMRTPEFDRENLINREILTASKLDLMADYEKEMEYLAAEFPINETDCYVCKEFNIGVTKLWK